MDENELRLNNGIVEHQLSFLKIRAVLLPHLISRFRVIFKYLEAENNDFHFK
jgi:hypothetical protein